MTDNLLLLIALTIIPCFAAPLTFAVSSGGEGSKCTTG